MDFSLSSWANPSSDSWWMQVLGRSRWRMEVVLMINRVKCGHRILPVLLPYLILTWTNSLRKFDHLITF